MEVISGLKLHERKDILGVGVGCVLGDSKSQGQEIEASQEEQGCCGWSWMTRTLSVGHGRERRQNLGQGRHGMSLEGL